MPAAVPYLVLGILAGIFSGLIGAKVANVLSTELLQKVFGSALLLIGARMIFFK